MSMLGHAVEVMIVKKEGEPLILDFWLENEEYLNLRKNPDIFDDVNSTPKLLKRLPLGFVHPYADDDDIVYDDEDDEDYDDEDDEDYDDSDEDYDDEDDDDEDDDDEDDDIYYVTDVDDEDEEDYRDVRGFLLSYDYMDVYADFEKKAKRIALDNIDCIILMSVINHEYGHDRYTYDWIKYRLSPKNVTTGSGVCNDPSDVKNCLKAVAST